MRSAGVIGRGPGRVKTPGRSARELELSGCYFLPLHKNDQNVSFARGMEIGYLIRCRYRQTPTEALMDGSKKRLIVVGDRVLVSPEEGEERTRVGLYLPPTAVDKREVQGGTVVATGSGTPVSAPTELNDEPWKIGQGEARYLPVEAQPGDTPCSSARRPWRSRSRERRTWSFPRPRS